MSSEAMERAERLERIRYELTLPCQSQFIRNDVEWLLAEVARLEQEHDEAQAARRRVPGDEGGPGHEEQYWMRAKLGAAITQLRDLEDFYRLRGGTLTSFNQVRADRARQLHEAITEDFLNGSMKRPTTRERAEAAEAALAVAREREQHLRDALNEAVFLLDHLTVEDISARSRRAILVAIKFARAALVDEPAAAIGRQAVDDYRHDLASLAEVQTVASVGQPPAAATLAEPEQASGDTREDGLGAPRDSSPVVGWDGRDADDRNPRSGSASAAADEPACLRCERLRDELAATMYQLQVADPARWRLHKQGQPMRLRAAADEPGDVLAGLPPDLTRLLRDPSIFVPQDAAVFKLIAEWMNAPSDTASADAPAADEPGETP